MMMPSIFNENLFDEMMNFPFEDDFFGKRNPLYGKHGRNVMKTDVKEKEDSYEVAVDLPGFKKEEISADLKNGYLTISAEKGLDKDEDDKNGNFIRRERYYGSCSRSFYVGSGVKEEDIKAKFEDGLLKLSIPKKDEKAIESPKRIAIEG
ncbi:MAG: Hsp20/alpha crystallin family protein [Bacillota bacterium]|nr:Hsp20/alpha crystallin family protein [Bacillota bacterium]